MDYQISAFRGESLSGYITAHAAKKLPNTPF